MQKQHSIFCSLEEASIVFDLRKSASRTAEGFFMANLVYFRSKVKGTTLKNADICMPTEVLTSLQRWLINANYVIRISHPKNEKHQFIFSKSSNIQKQILNFTHLWGRMYPELHSCLQQVPLLPGERKHSRTFGCRGPRDPWRTAAYSCAPEPGHSHHLSTVAQRRAGTVEHNLLSASEPFLCAPCVRDWYGYITLHSSPNINPPWGSGEEKEAAKMNRIIAW